ncbi:hypothetical protein V5O48_014234 [Marasmius crinis-equi]|uniref:Uncharacterized protein n=1 Tax=Marasmius crinis-equi TaxID=585013 RepID=A0ABR3EXZ0_9AGAR
MSDKSPASLTSNTDVVATPATSSTSPSSDTGTTFNTNNTEITPNDTSKGPAQTSTHDNARSPGPGPLEDQDKPDPNAERPCEEDKGEEEEMDVNRKGKKTKGKKKKGKKKKAPRGAQSHYTSEQVAFFEMKIPIYQALGNSRTKIAQFWLDFFPEYLERFPEATDHNPGTRKREDPALDIDKDTLKLMEVDEQRNLNKHVKRFNREDEERRRDAVKNHFHYLRTKQNRYNENPFGASMKKAQKGCGSAPQRLGLPQFVAQHEEFKDVVTEMSAETGRDDRLACRISAAQDLIEMFLPEEHERVLQLLKDHYLTWMEVYCSVKAPEEENRLDMEKEFEKARCRRALARVVGPFLDFVQESMGMAVFFQAGIELDDPEQGRAFDVVSMCSVPKGIPKFADFNMNFFQEHFGKTFAEWLRVVKRRMMAAGVEFPDFTEIGNDAEILRLLPSNSSGQGGGKKKAGGSGEKRGKKASASSQKSNTKKPKKKASSSLPSVPSMSSGNPAPSLSSYLDTSSTDALMNSAPPAPEHAPGQSYEDYCAARIAWSKNLFQHLGLDKASDYIFGGSSTSNSTSKKTPLNGDDDDYETSSKDELDGDDDDESCDHNLANSPTRCRYATRASAAATAAPDIDPAPAPIISNSVPHSTADDPDEGMDDVNPEGMGGTTNRNDEENDVPLGSTPDRPLPKTSEGVASESRESNISLPPSPAPRSDARNSNNSPCPLEDEDEIVAAPNPLSPAATADSNNPAQRELSKPLIDFIGVDFLDNVVVPRLPNDQLYPLEGVEVEFIRELAKFLLEGDIASSGLWTGVVYRWIELEEKWKDFQVSDGALPRYPHPAAFKVWFKARRTTRVGGLKTLKEVKLPQFRQMWWKWVRDVLAGGRL